VTISAAAFSCRKERLNCLLRGQWNFRILLPVPPERTKSHKTWDTSKPSPGFPSVPSPLERATQKSFGSSPPSPLRNCLPLAVLGLYRLRWQIELFFKRLKSLLAPGRVAFARRPYAQELDAGPLGRRSPGTASRAAVRSTFPGGTSCENCEPNPPRHSAWSASA